MDVSTVFKTPTRCCSFSSVSSTPGSCTPRSTTPRARRTPSSTRKTPGDRFIPTRAGADLQFSAYKVRSGGRRAGAAENRGSHDTTRTPLTPDPDSATRRKKLFALKGRSPGDRVLNIKQASTGYPRNQKTGEFIFQFTSFMCHVTCFFFLLTRTRAILESLQCL